MTTVQVLGLSASLLANALLIVWCMYLSTRVSECENESDHAMHTAHEAASRATLDMRMADREARP